MPSYRKYTPLGYVDKFGYLPDIDAAGANEEIWSAEGAYSGFVSAAAETSIVSGDVADDSAGTGARTVLVQGLTVSGSDWVETQETATMDGDTPVTLTNQFIRVYRAYVVTAGTGGVNAGAIQVKHGATVLADIAAGFGQTLQACYTVPNQLVGGEVINQGAITYWMANIGGVTASFATVGIQTRESGGAWRTRRIAMIAEGGPFREWIPSGIGVSAKCDIRARVIYNGANNSAIDASFTVDMW